MDDACGLSEELFVFGTIIRVSPFQGALVDFIKQVRLTAYTGH